MKCAESARIHPTAVVSPDAEIGERTQVGPYAVLDGRVTLGDDCIIRAGAVLYGPLSLGSGNVVHTGVVLGDFPQHLKYHGEETFLEIGDGNIFREHVTVHRGTTHSMRTVIGNHNFFMVGSHVAHDCVIGSRCILTNGCLVGGHCVLEDNVILSGNSAVHQFVRVGRLALLSGLSATTKDIPPFVIQQGIDSISGINVIGMRRAGMNNIQINAVRETFKMIFREGSPLPASLAKAQDRFGHVDAVQEMVHFLQGCHKGVNLMRSRFREEAA